MWPIQLYVDARKRNTTRPPVNGNRMGDLTTPQDGEVKSLNPTTVCAAEGERF
jgi:hypothetical protein